jgi:hypothetical protein
MGVITIQLLNYYKPFKDILYRNTNGSIKELS